MRTTLSLDDDVASLLHREIRRSGVSLKHAVNQYLRLGLAASKQPTRKAFIVTPREMGLLPGLTYDNIEELIEAVEGATHK